MYIVGMNYTTKVTSDGKNVKTTTLHVSEPFNEYYSNSEAGRGCMGERVEAIYVGTYDVSNLELGMNVDIYYERSHGNGNNFQRVKKIEILD